MISRSCRRATALKAEKRSLYLGSRDPRTPWYAKVLLVAVVAYAVSPIDLVPNFIRVLGYRDDLILLSLGMAWAIKLIPADLMADARARAQAGAGGEPPNRRAAAVVVIALWLVITGVAAGWPYGWLSIAR